VNPQHFRAFLWLRWRLLVNRLRRGGIANVVVLGILAVFGTFFAVGLFAGLFLVGLFVLADVSPAILMFVWDGVAVAFLFMWATGLLMELQRSEVLSLDKFLHLPVSLKSAFLINYVSSLFSVTLLIFAPAMTALALSLVIVRGPALLWQFPLAAAFLFMVTALTYQFQGWLASLMANKRRRRTIIVLVTIVFVLLVQVPNMINIMRPWEGKGGDDSQPREERAAATRDWQSGKIDAAEYKRRTEDIEKREEESANQTLQRVEATARVVNTALPPGWLPLGVEGASDGRLLPPLLGVLGMTAIGALSLWRSYRTTLRLYTGQYNSKPRKAATAAVAVSPPAGAAAATTGFLERELPGVSERVAAIALCGFRSLARAPEAKMMLLSPVILVVVFGSLYFRHGTTLPEMARPLIGFSAIMMMMLTSVQVSANQFGFDRGGFRVYVLSAAPRRDILVGKNLAFLPFALGLSVVSVGLVAVVQRMRVEHLLAMLPMFLCMYLPFCLMGNLLSILAPMPIRAGSFKPANPRVLPVLLHLAAALVMPLILAPALAPLAIEFVLQEFGWDPRIPVFLVLSLVECAAMIGLYRVVVAWQGDLLQAREQKILETVKTKNE
jgi:ABC-2 type transport system permease protein